MRRNCYFEHPELHPANRAWTLEQMNAQLQDPPPAPKVEGANVMERALIGDETEALEEQDQHEYSEFDHSLEMNMIMEATMQVADPYPV